MDVSNPARSVVPSLDADVLTVLAGTTRPLTGRDIGRLVRRGSPAGVQKVLNRLAEHGLVSVRDAGTARLYALNRDHVAAPAVLAMAGLRTALFDRIRTQVGSWRVSPVSALVFGSTARGDGDVESDVDVFLVRPDDVDADDPGWRAQVSDLSAAITSWTGNRASMIEVSVPEAQAIHDRNDPVASELVRDAVPVAGEPIADVLAGQPR